MVGEGHKTLLMSENCDSIVYAMRATDPYVRATAYFADGEVIYTNPFARYDASSQESPFDAESPQINLFLTIVFNLLLLVILSADIYAFYKYIIKR